METSPVTESIDLPLTGSDACPDCGSGSTVQVVYGLTDEVLDQAIADGDVVHGGWFPTDFAPTRHCKACHAQWVETDEYLGSLAG
ncbi:hypothetical protein [Agromyces mangrovi Wang et al. 2018]|uniref:hypothetical protein n=1 Tax=Agromyces mangrovi TaxID=1858653 RepID=UPI00257347F9|nr:hypothetical protein [Agromyces mangrovi]BDZ64172.1 hypothetical protein GCM10025877_11100 [Agromyces mangrovi]